MKEVTFYRKPDYIKELSKKLRNNHTKSEMLLWEYLKWKQINWLRFHRQKPIFAFREDKWFDRFYIADFYCHEKRLIVELDWEVHSSNSQKDYDKIRDEILKNNSYNILRFSNDEVFNNISFVLDKIKST